MAELLERARDWVYDNRGAGGCEEAAAEIIEGLLEDCERLVKAIKGVAWSEKDGYCWCTESPERHGMKHSEGCLRLRAALERRGG